MEEESKGGLGIGKTGLRRALDGGGPGASHKRALRRGCGAGSLCGTPTSGQVEGTHGGDDPIPSLYRPWEKSSRHESNPEREHSPNCTRLGPVHDSPVSRETQPEQHKDRNHRMNKHKGSYSRPGGRCDDLTLDERLKRIRNPNITFQPERIGSYGTHKRAGIRPPYRPEIVARSGFRTDSRAEPLCDSRGWQRNINVKCVDRHWTLLSP